MNPLILQIFGGLLVIGFIALLVMCRTTWRITHIIFSFLVFAATATFLVFASLAMKTQNEWRTLFEQYTVAVAEAGQKGRELQSGAPGLIELSTNNIRGGAGQAGFG